MTQLQRPQTSREAKAAYNKRCSKGRISKAERERLAREEKKEQRRLEAVRKEATRKLAARKRLEKEARQREERKRMGIPEPAPRISPGQLKIGDFLKGNITERDAAETSETPDPTKDDDTDLLRPDFYARAEHVSFEEQAEESKSAAKCDTAPSEAAVATNDTYRTLQDAMVSESTSPTLPAMDPGSSFFVSNSQIDRELQSDSLTDVSESGTILARHLIASQSVRSREEALISAREGTQEEVMKLPSMPPPSIVDVQALLSGIPSSELDYI